MNYDAIALWSQVISSVLFVVVLIWMFNKFAIPAVLKAQQSKNDEIARSEQHRDQAKAAVSVLKMEMGEAEHDAAAILERAKAQAEREHETAVQEAKAAGERALRSAAGELERAREAARVQLRNELAEKALELARRDARTRLTPALNAQLVDRFITSLDRGGRN
jgi:F-type H+-transporting ATPase subunit b